MHMCHECCGQSQHLEDTTKRKFDSIRKLLVCLEIHLTLKVLNFWKFTSYCSSKPLWSSMGEVIIIQLITLRQLKCSCLSNFHHQPGDFFRTGLLWHSTAADVLLQGSDCTVPTSVLAQYNHYLAVIHLLQYCVTTNQSWRSHLVGDENLTSMNILIVWV